MRIVYKGIDHITTNNILLNAVYTTKPTQAPNSSFDHTHAIRNKIVKIMKLSFKQLEITISKELMGFTF